MASKRDQGKTAFVKAVLAKNNEANPKLVNQEWTAAGNRGSISGTLVQKMRSAMGLTRNIRPGRKPNGFSQPRPTTPSPTSAIPVKRPVGRPPAHANGSAPRPAALRGHTSLLTKLEATLDEMIFEIKTAGGLPEFEETLRKARRILARSHQE